MIKRVLARLLTPSSNLINLQGNPSTTTVQRIVDINRIETQNKAADQYLKAKLESMDKASRIQAAATLQLLDPSSKVDTSEYLEAVEEKERIE